MEITLESRVPRHPGTGVSHVAGIWKRALDYCGVSSRAGSGSGGIKHLTPVDSWTRRSQQAFWRM
jgi:hypothetical protein